MAESMFSMWINSALTDSQADFAWVSANESEATRKNIRTKFCSPRGFDLPLWEEIIPEASSSVQADDSWKWISDFSLANPNERFLVVFDPYNYPRGVSFPDLHAFSLFIAESVGFQYYLTNESAEFLICENDHNFLIACGTAKKWLESHLLVHHADRLGKDILNYRFG